MTVDPEDAPDKTEKIRIDFENGVPVKVTNHDDKTVKTDALDLFLYLNELAGKVRPPPPPLLRLSLNPPTHPPTLYLYSTAWAALISWRTASWASSPVAVMRHQVTHPPTYVHSSF